MQCKVVEGLEEVLVVHLYLTLLQVYIFEPHVLVVILHLIGVWIQAAVGGNDTVAVEVVVAGGIAAVVAAIGKDFLTRDGALVTHALVYEVPDVAALILRILAHQVPILLEAAHRVAHGVGVLTLYEGARVVALRVGLTTPVVVIHGAEDVGLAVVASLLILAGARRVGLLHPVVGFLKVGAVAGLVA